MLKDHVSGAQTPRIKHSIVNRFDYLDAEPRFPIQPGGRQSSNQQALFTLHHGLATPSCPCPCAVSFHSPSWPGSEQSSRLSETQKHGTLSHMLWTNPANINYSFRCCITLVRSCHSLVRCLNQAWKAITPTAHVKVFCRWISKFYLSEHLTRSFTNIFLHWENFHQNCNG